MNTKYITNNTAVNLDQTHLLAVNGMTGDQRRALYVSHIVNTMTPILWIDTNGDPEVPTDAAAVANEFGIDQDSLDYFVIETAIKK